MRLRLPEPRLILLAVAVLALLAIFALAPAAVPRSGVAHAQTADPPADTEPTSAGICGRTPQVRDAILNRLSDVSQCSDVTGDHLASIDGELHLEEKDITSLRAGDFDGLTELRVLLLWHNQIEELPSGVFDSLTALEHLSLDHTRLGELPPGVFDSLTALKSLVLSYNRLGELPDGVFDSLTALKYLNLDHNRLGELPDGIFDQLTALENLSLWDNQIEELPPGVFDSLTALEYLSLSYNRLGELPDGIFDPLTALEYLSLCDNQIEELPPGIFDQLIALKKLSLDNNRLGELPDGIFDPLTALRSLFLNDNRLTTLPTPLLPNTAQGTPITRMTLYGNALAELPDRLFEADYSDYRALYLNDNPGTPFAFIIEGEVVGPSVQEGDNITAKVRYRVAQGAPVEMRARLSVTGGTASTPTVTIPAGRVHSEEITVTKSAESDSVTLTLHDVSAHISSGDPVELYQGFLNYHGDTDNEFSGIRFVAGAPFTVLAPPAPPDKPTAMAINPGAVELDWNDTFNTQSYGVGMLSDGSWVELPNGDVQVAFRESGAVVTGLPAHPVYVFAVRAKNRDGASGWSQHVSVASGQAATTTPTQAITTTTLPAPNTPTATLTPQDTVELDWQDVEDADSYEVRFLLDGQWVELPSDGVAVAVTGSSAEVSSLPDYDHYYFAVRAVKGEEKSGWSDWVKVSQPRLTPDPTTSTPTVAVAIALSPSGSVEEGTEITLTMSFANLESDTDTSDTDYIFRADVVDDEDGDADACEGGGMGLDRYMYQVDDDPEVRAGTIAASCAPGDYTVAVSISSPSNAELASATADFTVAAPAQQQQQAQEPPPSADATLSGLTLSDVTLAFASTTTDYTASVANDVTQTTVTPTTNDDGATYAIKLGGVADADGTVPLAVGSNVITVEVTAEDGETTRTYTVTVTRAAPPLSTDATLSSLALSDAPFTFASDTTSYDVNVANGVDETTVTPTTNDGGATYAIKLGGVADGDGTVSLAVGSNVITIEVTAEDGETTKTYTVTVTRAEPPSTDATLKSLALSGVNFGKFDPATTDYTASVANDADETTVTPTVNDGGASYVVKLGGAVDEDATVELSVGANTVSVVVTAEDGKTARTYTVTVNRDAPPEPVEPEEESTAERRAWLESNPENNPFVGEWQHFTLRGSGLEKVDLAVNVIGFGGAPTSTGAVGYSTASPPEAAGEVCESAYYSGYQMSVDATFSLVGCREGTVVIELLDPDDDYALLKRYTVTVNAGP